MGGAEQGEVRFHGTISSSLQKDLTDKLGRDLRPVDVFGADAELSPSDALSLAIYVKQPHPFLLRAFGDGRVDGLLYAGARGKEVEDAIALAEERFSQRSTRGLHTDVFENLCDGLVVVESGSDEVWLNDAARALLGIDSNQVVTQSYLKETLGFYPFDLVTLRGGDTPVSEELHIGDSHYHSMICPLPPRNSRGRGAIVSLRDVTDTLELARRQKDFVDMFSHEVRSPLTSIAGALELVSSEGNRAGEVYAGKYLAMAKESCQRLEQVLTAFLDTARHDSHRIPVEIDSVNLARLSQEATEAFRQTAIAKEVDLVLECRGGDTSIPGDEARLLQVLHNLLSNAVKFTPTGGQVDLAVFGPSPSTGHVGISVHNTGEPISASDAETIFAPFEPAKASPSRRLVGTGLGLAISRSIVEAHGGKLWAETQGEGTSFVMTLPSSLRSARAQSESEVVSTPTPGQASVLLIDGDADSAYTLKGVLMAGGLDVESASSPDEALALVRDDERSLIALNASTLEDPSSLLEILRHDSATRKSALMVLCLPEDRSVKLSGLAQCLLELPVDTRTLVAEARKLLQERRNDSAGKVLVVDDDDSIRDICSTMLKRSGLSVREAHNGHAALVEVKSFRPDLIIMDIMMPDMTGFEAAERIKSDSASALTPIIFLSAMGETESKVKAFKLGAEDYIVKPFVAAEMVARVKKTLARTHRDLGASPTTQLPGADAIEAETEERLSESGIAYCYLDLDNLKAYNDYYSYAKADSIIRQTATLILQEVTSKGTREDFVGHIAGDDFVFITRAECVDAICIGICEAFDRLVPLYYDRDDRERGNIQAEDRFGQQRSFDLMSVSIAAITDETGLDSYGDLAEAASKGKSQAKAHPGSCYYRDGSCKYPNE